MRTAAGVIAGYVAMVLTLFIAFTAVYQIIGTEASFMPGTFDPSVLWLVQSFVVGLVAAVVGGWVCKFIARSPRAIPALAVVVVVLGLVSAVAVAMEDYDPATNVRSGDVDGIVAMTQSRQPLWTAILNPIVGVIGVFIGGRLKKE